MFYGDNQQHKFPHIHAKYQDFEGVFSISDGELAINETNIFRIEPLR